MRDQFTFEDETFEFSPEINEQWEEERSRSSPVRGGGLRSRPLRPSRPGKPRPPGVCKRRPCPKPHPRRPRARGGFAWPLLINDLPPDSVESGVECSSEKIRWVQSTLNRILHLNLPVNGVPDVQTRSAVRSFQRQRGLPADGIVGPPTEAALIAASQVQPPQAQDTASEFETFDFESDSSEWESEITRTRQSIPLTLGVAGDPKIIDLTAKADKSKRFLIRDPKKVYALVLHQMACCYNVPDPLTRFPQRMAVHFVILPDGRILQLHPIQALTGASHGFNNGSVAVEFAGNFPNSEGKWWLDQEDLDAIRKKLRKEKRPEAQIQARIQAYIKANQNHVTPQQIEAGRYLVRYLIRTMAHSRGLTHILAHRQSHFSRENDPGPDIWYHVGQWAIDNLGLNDGGPGFKTGTGKPIPDLWRKWGQVKPKPELEFNAYESEAWETKPKSTILQEATMRNPFIFGIQPAQSHSSPFFREQSEFAEAGEQATTTPIEDRTAFSPKVYHFKDKIYPYANRDLKKVYALVLHHTAGSLINDPGRLNNVNAHFVITPNGRILQLHPLERLLFASNGFNPGSVAVEFVGNFRNEKGICWYKGPRFLPCSNTPTPEQIKAGRDLVKYLRSKINLTHILAHRQSSSSRDGDPGPDIWYQVGQWAVDNLGLNDGGSGYFILDGDPRHCKKTPFPESWKRAMKSPTDPSSAKVIAGIPADCKGKSIPDSWRRPMPTANPRQSREITFESTPPLAPASPALGGAKAPADFKAVKRKGVVKGLSRYATGKRLDRVLKSMKERGLISTSDADIDTFQRIANVETGGVIQALNTWDSAVVSIGFMQWTLQHGKVQEWIRRAPDAFKRFGIELDKSRRYQWGTDNTQIAIKGAATKEELRWNGWAERFYYAGLDEAAIQAEVELAKEWLQRHLVGLARRLKIDYKLFKIHYDASPWLRGIFQAAYNNKPIAAIIGTQDAVGVAKAGGVTATKDFRKLYADSILAAYKSLNDDGTRVVTETQRGSQQ
jgi:N-acetyl-anhydromuramyl-L-alanine amidase AmpD